MCGHHLNLLLLLRHLSQLRNEFFYIIIKKINKSKISYAPRDLTNTENLVERIERKITRQVVLFLETGIVVKGKKKTTKLGKTKKKLMSLLKFVFYTYEVYTNQYVSESIAHRVFVIQKYN